MPVAMRYGSGGSSSRSSGAGARLLWRNANPTSNFAAQNVPVDLSGYSYFAVLVRFHVSGVDMPMMVFAVNGEPKLLPVNAYTSNRTGGRTATYNDANKIIAFSGATYNGAANNAYAIPLEIWGLVL